MQALFVWFIYTFGFVLFVVESMFSLPAAGQSRQELPEELPELCVKDGVDDGVEGAVDVA